MNEITVNKETTFWIARNTWPSACNKRVMFPGGYRVYCDEPTVDCLSDPALRIRSRIFGKYMLSLCFPWFYRTTGFNMDGGTFQEYALVLAGKRRKPGQSKIFYLRRGTGELYFIEKNSIDRRQGESAVFSIYEKTFERLTGMRLKKRERVAVRLEPRSDPYEFYLG